MGNLHFKRDEYHWGDTFYVYDEHGNRKYYVKSSVLLWNRKFVICDLQNNELVEIKKDPKSLVKKKFDIFIDEQLSAEITKEVSIIPKFTIELLDWTHQGMMRHEFKLTCGSRTTLTMSEEFTPWGHHPILTFDDAVDEILALSVALTLGYVVFAEDGHEPTNYL